MHAFSAVYINALAGNIASLLGTQQSNHCCTIRGLSVKANRNEISNLLCIFCITQRLDIAVGIDHTGSHIVDGNTNEVVAYRNVLQMAAETHTYESGDYVRLDIELVGEGTGYFACDGKVVPICWSRSSESEPFVFTHEDGTPITFGMGNTYIAIKSKK